MSRGRTIEDSQKDYQKLKERVGMEEINRRARDWRKANPEKYRDTLARCRKNNPERNILNKSRGRAKKAGIEHTISLEDIKIPEVCPYFKQKLDPWGDKDFCPSIDRIDNSKGYVPGNIEIISYLANKMKHTASDKQLLQFAHGILERSRERNDSDEGQGHSEI